MSNITYRASTTPTVPVATTAKGSTLTTDEMDGNLKSLSNDIDTINAAIAGGVGAVVGYEQIFLMMGA